MSLKVERQTLESGIEVFHLAGSLILGSESQNLETTVVETGTENRGRVVLNLAGLAFLDSAGIGVLISCHGKIFGAGGQLRVANANTRVQNILRLTRADTLLRLDHTVDDSLRAIAATA